MRGTDDGEGVFDEVDGDGEGYGGDVARQEGCHEEKMNKCGVGAMALCDVSGASDHD